MQNLFLTILDMHRTAAVVILVVLVMRLLLRKAPKKWSYALWSVVGFRLACPVSLPSVFSLFNLRLQPVPTVETTGTFQISGPTETLYAPADATIFNYSQNAGMPASTPAGDPMELWLNIGTAVWLLGIAALLVYSIISYVKLYRQMSTAIRLNGNVWQSDQVRSPFILGFIKPNIYIPFGLDDNAQRYVLAHERCHLKHLDHWVKPFAFLLLAIHWFDPLVWVAFHLMGRDMEMRTDEEVLTETGGSRKTYSVTLLSFAANRRFPAPSPLAFGETGVKARIKNALNWKRPRVWMTVLAAALCIAVVAACAADPKEQTADDPAGDPVCTVSVSGLDAEPSVRWFPEGFDFDYNKLTPLGLPCQDSYELVFTPSWECEALKIGQDYYTRSGSAANAYCESYDLTKEADGNFHFTVQRMDVDVEEDAVYYIPYGDGKFVFQLVFAAADSADWGVQLSAADVTTTGLTLTFSQSGPALDGELNTSEAFWLEIWKNGQWTQFQDEKEDVSFRVIAYEIPNNDSITMELNWDHVYGALPNGSYRICKQVYNVRNPLDYDEQTYCAEFTIGSDTPPGESSDVPTSVVTTRTPLEDAVHQAIMEHGKSPYSDQYFSCESHVTLAHMTSDGLADDDSGWRGQDILYLMVLYQEYTLTEDGVLDDGSGSHMPVMLTFDRYSDGTFELVEYWTPDDGADYASSIRETFPDFIWEDALDTQKYILPQIQNCYAQAVAYGQLETEHVIEKLFDTIKAAPDLPPIPTSYKELTYIPYRELLYYGDHTLMYIFRQFADGRQDGLDGHLMRIVMEQLLGAEAIEVEASTGQDYFDQWRAHVLELSNSHNEIWMQENAPKGWMLLQRMDETP